MTFRFIFPDAIRKLVPATLLILGTALAGCTSSIPPTGLKPSPEPAEKDRSCYLFAYTPKTFLENDDSYDPLELEQICYAVSTDGREFFALNGGRPVINAKKISRTGGVHDPYLMRTEDGGFYMLASDLTTNLGIFQVLKIATLVMKHALSRSPILMDPVIDIKNDGIVLMKSDDLINWSTVAVDFTKRFRDIPDIKSLHNVRMPHAIYDPAAKKYLVYFSMSLNGSKVYGAYATPDFTDFESEPQPVFELNEVFPFATLADAEIVPFDGKYYMIVHDHNSGSDFEVLVSDTLFPGKWETATLSQSGNKKDKIEKMSNTFRIKNTDSLSFITMPDDLFPVRRGTDTFIIDGNDIVYTWDIKTFSRGNDFSADFVPQHGSVVPIARSELNALLKKWGKPEKFELPVQNNPIIEAFYADPGTLYSEKTGKYYIYPTHDGVPGWGGKDFQVFSSSDLKEWKFERTILTLGEDVKWSSGNAWAPCIMERKQPDGSYKYYFYFCGALKDDGRKCIGCAVADDPLGPFVDTGKPIVDFKPEGVRGGQEIDPDVFRDPVSGKYYLYWGNGYMAGGELADDMLSVKRDTVKVFRPGRTFREGTNVIYRNGKYYFSWSVDDTGSPNYHVRYATADSPLGDLTVPRDNVVIEKNEAKGILGTGHHQILKVHGTDDEWRIVYHRFAWQNGRIMDGPGYHREVCIDKLEFNPDGSIRKVVPTL